MERRPNILWLCTDQQRYDTIRALGNDHLHTPNLDAMVERGVSFPRAYCQSPVCTPSRASFMTGRYPRTTRCRQNGQAMPPDEVLVSKMFADAGYRCGLAGKLHLAACQGMVETRIDDGYHDFFWSHHPQPDWPENAYTQWLTEKGVRWEDLYDQGERTNYVCEGMPAEHHQTTWCAEKTIEFLQANAGSSWFFNFNCFAPHHPFDPPKEYLDRYKERHDIDALPLPKQRAGELDNKPVFQQLDARFAHNNPDSYDVAAMSDRDKREVIASYYAMCEHIDFEVGRILEALRASGQWENTIVVFMSDHGEMLGDHGLLLKGPHFYEEAVRVPLVMQWPGQFEPGLQPEAMVELTDLAPTFLQAAGLDIPERVQGRSLLPILTGEAEPDQHRDAVFSEYYNAWSHRGDAYGTMLRTAEAKIVVYHGSEPGELYDLVQDPDEFENLWSDPDSAELKTRLMKQCFDASVFTMDPVPPRLGDF